MKKKSALLILLFISYSSIFSQSFKEQQKKAIRVSAAYNEKWENLKNTFKRKRN